VVSSCRPDPRSDRLLPNACMRGSKSRGLAIKGNDAAINKMREHIVLRTHSVVLPW
jgi:hypothetical protein